MNMMKNYWDNQLSAHAASAVVLSTTVSEAQNL